MKRKKVVIGLVAGISVGVIAAILLSTGKGADVRKKIINKTSNLGNSLKDWVTGFIKNGKEVKVASS
jgi:hypothetical protein